MARKQQVHAFVHRETHRAPLMALGAAAVSVGALDDTDAIAQAAQGARAVYHICPNVSRLELPFACAVADGVARAGVGRFVFHSVLHPQIEAMPHHWQKARVEEMLFARKLDVTVLQPTAYMQNILAGWQGIAGDGVYRVPYPAATRISLATSTTWRKSRRWPRPTTPISAPATNSPAPRRCRRPRWADTLGAALGRPVRVISETPDAWAARARAAGMDDYQRDTLTAMFRYYERHGLVGNPTVLTALLGRPPTTLAAFARRAAGGDVSAIAGEAYALSLSP